MAVFGLEEIKEDQFTNFSLGNCFFYLLFALSLPLCVCVCVCVCACLRVCVHVCVCVRLWQTVRIKNYGGQEPLFPHSASRSLFAPLRTCVSVHLSLMHPPYWMGKCWMSRAEQKPWQVMIRFPHDESTLMLIIYKLVSPQTCRACCWTVSSSEGVGRCFDWIIA